MDATHLLGFAYGEHVESGRSLGYRLLTPATDEGWTPEVDSLARRLQATPYPHHWPESPLFCSVLLADGSRIIAEARYGLVDHTRSQRRGGLELVGVLAPGCLGVPSALAIYRWLKQRRSVTGELRELGGRFDLAAVLAEMPPIPSTAEPMSMQPMRVFPDGVQLFAASAPTDPDTHLALLERGDAVNWQWLGLVGEEFPFAEHAARGPLIAWTPQPENSALPSEEKGRR